MTAGKDGRRELHTDHIQEILPFLRFNRFGLANKGSALRWMRSSAFRRGVITINRLSLMH